ncbi:MAG: tetratricopeptide repeat protein [Coriobacteriia bacterium]|nr:tetratricopeptide repeat protein [Coriobacteriia bacterium]
MNSENYSNATIAYNSGDYIKALEGYYLCLTTDSASFGPGDAGLIYHRLGNCLVKVERYEEAVAVYRKSLEDDNYSERGSIHVNLGTALSAIDRNEDAIVEFQSALDDTEYSAPYRAWMGLGNALSKLGRIVDAGTAYRTAALDPNNPNPVKALMNLGSSFSSLDRPADAVEAYLAILDFRVTGSTLNRTYERLANAYFADGQFTEAVQAFNDALMGGNYQLSERSLTQLAQARMALASPTDPSVLASIAMSSTGSNPSLEDSSSLRALDTEVSSILTFGTDSQSDNEIDFFTATDEELIAVSKRQLRRERNTSSAGLKILVGVLAAVVLVFGSGILAFTQGLGFPSQKAVINGFFDSHAKGTEVSSYWIDDAQADPVAFARMIQAVAEVDSSAVTIRTMDRSISESEAVVDVRLPEGGIVHYRVNLVRDGVGWKINGIELIFASQNQ